MFVTIGLAGFAAGVLAQSIWPVRSLVTEKLTALYATARGYVLARVKRQPN